MSILVHSYTPVTLVGRAPFAVEVLEQAIAHAPTIIGADRGGEAAAALGHTVSHVIGDMDSGTDVPGAKTHRIDDQDTTDFEKCLDGVDAPYFLAVGFTGRRMDHTLANLQVLLTRPDKRVILLDETDLILLAPLETQLRLPIGTRISLFPLAPVKASSTGLHWPLDEVPLAPDQKSSMSNEASADEIRITLNERKALLILPRENLITAINQLFGE